MEIETWAAVVGYEEIYEVSDLGRVRSLDRISSHGRQYKGKILQSIWTKQNANPYPAVNLYYAGTSITRTIHRLVLEAFVGSCPPDWQACHNDGNPKNSRLDNLRWDSLSSNQLDRYKHGTLGQAKPVMRDDGLEFASAREATRCLGLHQNGIYQAIRGGTKCGGHKWRYHGN